MDEKEMNMSWGLELMLDEQLAERRREAERDRIARLARSGRAGGRARRGGWVRWHAWMNLIRAASIRLQHRPLRRSAEFSADRGPQS